MEFRNARDIYSLVSPEAGGKTRTGAENLVTLTTRGPLRETRLIDD